MPAAKLSKAMSDFFLIKSDVEQLRDQKEIPLEIISRFHQSKQEVEVFNAKEVHGISKALLVTPEYRAAWVISHISERLPYEDQLHVIRDYLKIQKKLRTYLGNRLDDSDFATLAALGRKYKTPVSEVISNSKKIDFVIRKVYEGVNKHSSVKIIHDDFTALVELSLLGGPKIVEDHFGNVINSIPDIGKTSPTRVVHQTFKTMGALGNLTPNISSRLLAPHFENDLPTWRFNHWEVDGESDGARVRFRPNPRSFKK